jgi:hypothetical protein
MHPTAHAVHASTHSVHPSSHAVAAAATATTASGERRRRKSKRRTNDPRDETVKKLVVHLKSSVLEMLRPLLSLRRGQPQDRNDQTISTDKCDTF